MQYQNIIPVQVSLVNGQPMVSSLIVAETFGKGHFHVIRDIRELGCSEKFDELNFERVDYLDAKGESRPAYNMTEQGFALLAMGYTGAKAMAFKEAFLAEFVRMREELHRRDVELIEKLERDNRVNAFPVYCKHQEAGLMLAANYLDWMIADTFGPKNHLSIKRYVRGLLKEAKETTAQI